MKKRADANFAIKTWDEKPYSEAAGMPKLTRASVKKTFTGYIGGDSEVEYLMMYNADGTAAFVGLERIVGRLGGKSGSFVLQRSGSYDGKLAKETYSVVPGSGTGQLTGLSGQGSSSAGHGKENPITLDYELD